MTQPNATSIVRNNIRIAITILSSCRGFFCGACFLVPFNVFVLSPAPLCVTFHEYKGNDGCVLRQTARNVSELLASQRFSGCRERAPPVACTSEYVQNTVNPL